jgi:ROK family
MTGERSTAGIGKHGAERLPSVDIDSYAIELKGENGFLGDRASRGAFNAILEGWRRPLRKAGDDPFGNRSSAQINRKDLDQMLCGDDVEAAAVVLGMVEEFAQELALVTRRFLKTKAWRSTEAIIVGGGFRLSRIGEIAIARAGIILKSDGEKLDLKPIRHHTDEAGLIGCLHLAPTWTFEAYDAILAVDIGGSKIRCGLVEPRLDEASDLSKARVWHALLWRHADEGATREGAVRKLVKMLNELIGDAEAEAFKLAPFIGVACPGVINADGSIEKGAQNLPGNWESDKFNLTTALVEAIPAIGDHDTTVLMHNDAVAQGLSEVPFMQEFRRWGVLTIGTGLGNARFTGRKAKDRDEDE